MLLKAFIPPWGAVMKKLKIPQRAQFFKWGWNRGGYNPSADQGYNWKGIEEGLKI